MQDDSYVFVRVCLPALWNAKQIPPGWLKKERIHFIMPKLTIDNREIEVPEGTKVIEAAERLGIMIPRFCYHRALGSVGACRVCAVKFVDGPKKGIDMSCMVDAQDGMVVSTTDEEAVLFRKYVIEWMMLNHPHDCPVCDEGGHCLLQDETVSGGHGVRRYLEKKRTYEDQYLGPFVQHEMNRCIQCFRCRRFYQDFAGYRDLGVMQIGNREYFGRAESGKLESPFSGNLIDICPTGVYTDKPARFKGRRWNFLRGPSLCIHCSLGCSTTGSVRYREIVRQESRLDKEVNGHFICDRGRFGFDFANHPERIRKPLVDGREVGWDQAMEAVSAKLKEITDRNGTESALFLGSARCSLETQDILKKAGRLLNWQESRYFIDRGEEDRVEGAVKGLDEGLAASLSEIEDADFILALGVDPVNEAPMLAMAMRQAWSKGAEVVVADPRPVKMPFDFHHFPMKSSRIDSFAGYLAGKAFKEKNVEEQGENIAKFYRSLPEKFKTDPNREEKIEELARKLTASKRPVIISGTNVTGKDSVEAAADLARFISRFNEGARLFYVLPGPNAFGAGLMTPEKREFSIPEAIESGQIRALVLVEQDPLRFYPDRKRLEKAFEKLEYLAVLDYLPSLSVKKANAVLPTTTLFEKSPVTMLNQEGRIRRVSPLHQGGTPVFQLSDGSHPPRTFPGHIPGADPRPAHELIAELYTAVSGNGHDRLLKEVVENPALSKTQGRILYSGKRPEPFAGNQAYERPEDKGIMIHPVELTFGTEELSCYSRFTMEAEDTPCFFMHHDDAERLSLAEGEMTSIDIKENSLSLELKLSSSVAPGVIILPRHHTIHWQIFDELPAGIEDKQIHKQ